MKKLFASLCLLALSLTTFAATFNIYIDNQTGWEQTALYGWYDGGAQPLGGWPGMQATTTQDKYLVFTVEETIVPVNLIFNNNGNGMQTADFSLTEAKDIHLVAADGALKLEGTPEPTYNYYIYIEDQTGWDDFALFAWYAGKSEANMFGSWPGKRSTETKVVSGVTYKVFPAPDDVFPSHLIVNNGGNGTQLADYDVTEAKDYYLVASSTGVREAGTPEPEFDYFNVTVDNRTGWDNFYMYAWGTYDAFGGWPGTTEAVSQFRVEKNKSITLNLIFHNNVGEGLEGDQRVLFTISEARDYSITVTATEAKEGVQPSALDRTAAEANSVKRIVNGQLVIEHNGKMFNALGAEL